MYRSTPLLTQTKVPVGGLFGAPTFELPDWRIFIPSSPASLCNVDKMQTWSVVLSYLKWMTGCYVNGTRSAAGHFDEAVKHPGGHPTRQNTGRENQRMRRITKQFDGEGRKAGFHWDEQRMHQIERVRHQSEMTPKRLPNVSFASAGS